MSRVKASPTEERREIASLAIFKRKVAAMKLGLDGDDAVDFTFTPSELLVLREVARGHSVPGVRLTTERAREEMRWVRRGGRYR